MNDNDQALSLAAELVDISADLGQDVAQLIQENAEEESDDALNIAYRMEEHARRAAAEAVHHYLIVRLGRRQLEQQIEACETGGN